VPRPRRFEALALPIALIILAGCVGLLTSKFEPLLDGHQRAIGGDYSYFLPRLLAGDYWQRLNGWWAVQWFTPAFCGGMPSWANPQSMQFSIPQWLTQFVDPVTAVQWTFFIAAVSGGAGMFLLLKDGFKTSTASALAAGVLFLFNGFFSRRMVSGHLAFHTAMWAPWVGWLLVREQRSSRERVVCVVLAGLGIAFMIHGGLVVLLPPLVLAWLSLSLLTALRGRAVIPAVLQLVAALALGAALSASKLAAMQALLTQFPRNYYPLAGFRTVSALLGTVLHALFLRAQAPERIDMQNDIIRSGEHEWDFGLSPAPALLLLGALPFVVSALRRSARSRIVPLLCLAVLFVVPLAVNFYTPGWNAFLKSLPIISANSLLTRWLFYYVVVIPILAAFALELLPFRLLLAGGAIGIAVVWTLTGDPTLHEERFLHYSPETVLKGWRRTHEDGTVPRIQLMSAILRSDGTAPRGIFQGDDLVAVGASQVFCYEPLFGYELERLPWQPLHDGPALDEKNGQLNVKNPVCDLFPQENHCRAGGQFLSAQRLEAEAFLDWSPIPFRRSPLQVVADVLNVAVLAVVGLFLMASGLSWLRRRRGA
jgi:hypothetical protein